MYDVNANFGVLQNLDRQPHQYLNRRLVVVVAVAAVPGTVPGTVLGGGRRRVLPD